MGFRQRQSAQSTTENWTAGHTAADRHQAVGCQRKNRGAWIVVVNPRWKGKEHDDCWHRTHIGPRPGTRRGCLPTLPPGATLCGYQVRRVGLKIATGARR